MKSISSNVSNPSGRTMLPGFAQPLTEVSARNLSAGKGLPAHKENNFAAIYEPVV
jgi:hypothetical protein